jgi:hypothetical protein
VPVRVDRLAAEECHAEAATREYTLMVALDQAGLCRGIYQSPNRQMALRCGGESFARPQAAWQDALRGMICAEGTYLWQRDADGEPMVNIPRRQAGGREVKQTGGA